MRSFLLLCVVCAVLGNNTSFVQDVVTGTGVVNDVSIHVRPGPNPGPVQHEVSVILQSLQRLFGRLMGWPAQEDDPQLFHA